MDEPARRENCEMHLSRPALRERQIARSRIDNRDQAKVRDQRRHRFPIPAPQRIAARRRTLEAARLERPGRQPDAIEPGRRLASMQSKSRTDSAARSRDHSLGYASG